ncbi:alpha/beta fold hydrolase [Cupriavidus malaysiensis]|uniref:AB hydrolase-1 domain-containing protein n=1 Tax=Cupriavidus malaysiensis TaxID=367825 RepID=A0ABN4TNR4_9BURK|nr:alpha/beta hydrolase [Cupriavidus malaysiensis]AOZ08977.1 hypothetical protein BKK80_24250 [Cupriavidus malaysiensis]
MMPYPPPAPLRRRSLQTLATLPAAWLLASLSACGGGGGGEDQPAAAAVSDRQVTVAPGVALHVRDWNPSRPGRTVVLLAGLGGNAQGFNGLAAALARRARVLAISRRGYGRSDKPLPAAGGGYDPATLVADLDAVLRTLRVDEIVLCGHSIAGNELTLFAGRYPHRVRGLVYLDTSYDYTRPVPWHGEPPPDNPALEEPEPGPADQASLAAATAFARRVSKLWSAAAEAQLRDSLTLLPDGSVRPNTPAPVAAAMADQGHAFSPDYRAVASPALIVAAEPGAIRDMFPWLSATTDAATLADAQTMLGIFRQARRIDAGRLAAALPGSRVLWLPHASHANFFDEYQGEVVRAIESMPWYEADR